MSIGPQPGPLLHVVHALSRMLRAPSASATHEGQPSAWDVRRRISIESSLASAAQAVQAAAAAAAVAAKSPAARRTLG